MDTITITTTAVASSTEQDLSSLVAEARLAYRRAESEAAETIAAARKGGASSLEVKRVLAKVRDAKFALNVALNRGRFAQQS